MTPEQGTGPWLPGHRHPAMRYLFGLDETVKQRRALIFARFGFQLFVASMLAWAAPLSLLATGWAIFCAVRGVRLYIQQRRAITERRNAGPVDVAVTEFHHPLPRHAAWLPELPETCTRSSDQLSQTGTVA